jgi:hypothetical protein
MSTFGTSIAQSVAGAPQAERLALRESEKKTPAKPFRLRRGQDELDLEVETAQATDAVRNLKGNAQEETDEDRTGQDHYRPQNLADQSPTDGKHIDIQG